jgi:hypothetical protein
VPYVTGRHAIVMQHSVIAFTYLHVRIRGGHGLFLGYEVADYRKIIYSFFNNVEQDIKNSFNVFNFGCLGFASISLNMLAYFSISI